MKKGLLFSLMLVFILALCLTATSCPEPSNTIPAELVGKWGYTLIGDTELFEIKSNGTIVFAGPTTYDISVSGNTVTLKYSNNDMGSFKYSITSNQMTISDTTGACNGWAIFSPLKKL